MRSATIGWIMLVALAACSADNPPCDCGPAEAFAAETPDTPGAQVVTDVWGDLLAKRYDAVRQRFEPALAADLTGEKLGSIMDGVTAHHGEGRLIHAWTTTVKDGGRRWDAAAAIIKHDRSTTRFRLLLVFNDDHTIRGLWNQPL